MAGQARQHGHPLRKARTPTTAHLATLVGSAVFRELNLRKRVSRTEEPSEFHPNLSESGRPLLPLPDRTPPGAPIERRGSFLRISERIRSTTRPPQPPPPPSSRTAAGEVPRLPRETPAQTAAELPPPPAY